MNTLIKFIVAFPCFFLAELALAMIIKHPLNIVMIIVMVLKTW